MVRSGEKQPLDDAFQCLDDERARRIERTRNYKEPTSPLWYGVPLVMFLLGLVGVWYRIRSRTNDVELDS